MNQYTLSKKIDNKHVAMIQIRLNKNGYPQVSFTPESKPYIRDWLKSGNADWLNFDLKDWGPAAPSPSEPSPHDQDKSNGHQQQEGF